MKAVIINKEWAICSKCGHKLCKIVSCGNETLSIKCSSCKEMNEVEITK